MLRPSLFITCLLSTLSLSLSLHIKTINATRTLSQLETLATLNDLPLPAVQRIVFTKSDIAARAYIRKLMTEANLTVREDALGNIFGRWVGRDGNKAAIATGSHFDAIPYSGMYDGTFGVIGAIEAVRCLQSAGFEPERSVEVIAFTSEEPTRFGLGCVGSRGLSGSMDAGDFERLSDSDGVSFDEARRGAGYAGAVSEAVLETGVYAGFVELHIEQGRVLEEGGVDIGVVTSIAAPAGLRVEFVGSGGHAGGLLMEFRSDAGLAGAELALAVERAVLESGSVDTVGTTGGFRVLPGAVNSVPRVAELEIDVRDVERGRRDVVLGKIVAAGEEIAKRRGVRFSMRTVNADDPARCSDVVIEAVEKAAEVGGLSEMRMVSRAYHDSLFMARLFPTGMIFVPCKGGVSHNPDEYISSEAISNGVKTLANTLILLAGIKDHVMLNEEL